MVFVNVIITIISIMTFEILLLLVLCCCVLLLLFFNSHGHCPLEGPCIVFFFFKINVKKKKNDSLWHIWQPWHVQCRHPQHNLKFITVRVCACVCVCVCVCLCVCVFVAFLLGIFLDWTTKYTTSVQPHKIFPYHIWFLVILIKMFGRCLVSLGHLYSLSMVRGHK